MAGRTRRLPGLEGVWVFIGADLMFFTMLFVSFMLDRRAAPALYEAGRATLDPDFGGVNTLILLSSSWAVVLALRAVRRGRLDAAPRLIAIALGFGLAFCASKSVEYGGKLRAGLTPATNEFYMYYFALTGIHLLHVVGGCVMLAFFHRMARARAFTPEGFVVLECGGLYWHMVDLLWIVLFPLLYLLR